MQEIKINTKFEVGELIGCKTTKRYGRVVKVFHKLIPLENLVYKVNVSYSVQPEVASHNNFRIPEIEASDVVNDNEGNSHFIKKE